MPAQPCRITFAWHVDQAGYIAPEWIAPDEHRHFLTFLQVQDSGRHIAQLRCTDLEKLVPRKGFQDMNQCFAVMAVRRKTGFVDNLAYLAANNRDRLNLLGVDG